jgi:hypothetical protein
MQRVFQLLDSVFLARVGRAGTLIRIIGLGALPGGRSRLGRRGGRRVAAWVPLVCFGIWALLVLLLVVALLLRRQPSTLASPGARIVIAKDLPYASAALLRALSAAEARGREFIADAASMDLV